MQNATTILASFFPVTRRSRRIPANARSRTELRVQARVNHTTLPAPIITRCGASLKAAVVLTTKAQRAAAERARAPRQVAQALSKAARRADVAANKRALLRGAYAFGHV